MLIGEFARRTGLSQDTIRFYVRKKLLRPRTGAKGGRQPWQIFTEQDVSTARIIRFAQSLGLSLREIAEIDAELHRDDSSPQRELGVLDTQLARLEQKAADLAGLIGYLRAKRDWVARGRPDHDPHLPVLPCASPRGDNGK
ncbi:MerR family transcriptional regulator [Paracoccus sp. (in: a-proteobacteria)]|uniref:MerR family transcriptional regulator n=1 Tax=Paracoccus sp. TaxID=267 RepID=UPI0039E2A0B2